MVTCGYVALREVTQGYEKHGRTQGYVKSGKTCDLRASGNLTYPHVTLRNLTQPYFQRSAFLRKQ